jgi:hypothetical protein
MAREPLWVFWVCGYLNELHRLFILRVHAALRSNALNHASPWVDLADCQLQTS